MFGSKLRHLKIAAGLLVMLALSIFVTAPLMASASNANRVFYSPDPSSFNPAGAFGGDIAEGGGKGINKLTINAGPQGYYVTFVVNNNNESGRTGTTFFETRKGSGNTSMASNVQLSATSDFTNATNTITLNFNGTADTALYVRVYVPACGTDGSFRIQAHPGGSTNQGNGPGVVVNLNCNGFVPTTPTPTPAPTPTPTVCYDYYGRPYNC